VERVKKEVEFVILSYRTISELLQNLTSFVDVNRHRDYSFEKSSDQKSSRALKKEQKLKMNQEKSYGTSSLTGRNGSVKVNMGNTDETPTASTVDNNGKDKESRCSWSAFLRWTFGILMTITLIADVVFLFVGYGRAWILLFQLIFIIVALVGTYRENVVYISIYVFCALVLVFFYDSDSGHDIVYSSGPLGLGLIYLIFLMCTGRNQGCFMLY